jgi:2-polyprenyl-3-methyl-5-hydroxy-6-metoxy-1,4-benzoquinol methylase
MSFPTVARFEETLKRLAPYMGGAVERGRVAFGPEWEARFEESISRLFGEPEALEKATQGYVEFALDGLRLHKRFEKELKYVNRTYEECAREVYHNRDYMFGLYLPGILLSHYLWPHHYNGFLYFDEVFAPLMRAASEKTFADVGVGTGFYCRQGLMVDSAFQGKAFDISQHSLDYADRQVTAFGVRDRWTREERDIVARPPEEKFQFVLSVEVLEHLEDPVAFIRSLKGMLAPGGYAFITAAIAAPNFDHIHLYMNSQDVIDELVEGGFEVVEYRDFMAYEPRGDAPVPVNGCFVCR